MCYIGALHIHSDHKVISLFHSQNNIALVLDYLKLPEFWDIIAGFGLLGILSAMQSSEESISAQSNSDNKTLRLEQPVILSPPTL